MRLSVKVDKEIYISDSDQKKVTLNYLRDKFKIPKSSFIKDGILMETVTYATSHSWDEDEKVRVATDIDKAVFKVIKELSR